MTVIRWDHANSPTSDKQKAVIQRPGLVSSALFALLGVFFTNSSYAIQKACDRVAHQAGSHYVSQPDRFATFVAPEELPKELHANLIERSGLWFIYQSDRFQFDKSACAPVDVRGIELVPVVLNERTGSNAVINGVFLIQTWHTGDVESLGARYGFRKITSLPNRFTAVFDSRPQKSYDDVVHRLSNDKDIQHFVPLLSELNAKPAQALQASP